MFWSCVDAPHFSKAPSIDRNKSDWQNGNRTFTIKNLNVFKEKCDNFFFKLKIERVKCDERLITLNFNYFEAH